MIPINLRILARVDLQGNLRRQRRICPVKSERKDEFVGAVMTQRTRTILGPVNEFRAPGNLKKVERSLLSQSSSLGHPPRIWAKNHLESASLTSVRSFLG